MQTLIKKHAGRTGAIAQSKTTGKWRARMMIERKYKHIGMFATREQAQQAINDLLFDIENGQYSDPVKRRKDQRKIEIDLKIQDAQLINTQAARPIPPKHSKNELKLLAKIAKKQARLDQLAAKPLNTILHNRELARARFNLELARLDWQENHTRESTY